MLKWLMKWREKTRKELDVKKPKRNNRLNYCSKRVNAIQAAGNVPTDCLRAVKGSVGSVSLRQFQFENPAWQNFVPHMIECMDCQTAFYTHLKDRLYRIRKEENKNG